MERHDDPSQLYFRNGEAAERAGGARELHRSGTEAPVRKNYWPWIWAVPIAAIGVIAWLGVRTLSRGGVDITIALPQADGASNQTNVMFRGVKVGNITGLRLAKDQKSVVADVHMDSSVEGDMVSGSRFYLEDAKPTLTDLSSLKSVIAGPNLVMVPGTGAPSRHFAGIIGSPPEHLTTPVTYAASFSGAVGALKAGDPVTFRGFHVGEIRNVMLASDVPGGRVTTTALIALDAARFHLDAGDRTPTGLSTLLGKLVGQGLRAQMEQDPPLVGAKQVVLEMVPDAPAASMQTGGAYPEIPVAEGGDIQTLIAKLGKLPVTQIGENVRQITAHVNRLTSSPKLQDMIANADRTTVELDRVVHQAGPQVGPTIADLRKTASQLDAAAMAAKQMMGGSVTAPEGNLQQSLRELTDASRAVRSLADYLDQHPEALIKGR